MKYSSKVPFELEGSWALAKRGKTCTAQHANPLQQGVTMSLGGNLCLPGLALSIPGHSGGSLGHLQALALPQLH